MIAIDEKALEAAQAALHGAWDANPDSPGVMYGREAETLARAAITAYLTATKDAQAERVRVLEGALKLIAEMDGDQPARSEWDMLRLARAALRGAP